MATANFARRVGKAVQAAADKGLGWFSPHMAAASRAIAERVPLVDFVLEVRDARIPISSECELLRRYWSSSKHFIVLNKMDLADRAQTKEWLKHFQELNCNCYGVNSHNKENVKEFLNLLQAKVRGLKKVDQYSHTTTIMLVGIPNVGKSALSNSLHQIGRISAAEKGKLRHAKVTPMPGETKDITSLKIGSHPNIYVLDAPGVLPRKIHDVEVCSKLAITGAINDCLVGERELSVYFLAILNVSDTYKNWEKLPTTEDMYGSKLEMRRKGQYHTDHTQDSIVRDVRRALFQKISSFKGSLEDEKELIMLIEAQFVALMEVFHVHNESGEDVYNRVAIKLLNLYRTGRLGHYTLDRIPRNAEIPTTV